MFRKKITSFVSHFSKHFRKIFNVVAEIKPKGINLNYAKGKRRNLEADKSRVCDEQRKSQGCLSRRAGSLQ